MGVTGNCLGGYRHIYSEYVCGVHLVVSIDVDMKTHIQQKDCTSGLLEIVLVYACCPGIMLVFYLMYPSLENKLYSEQENI